MLEGYLDNLKQPIKIDISTGDVITPAAIEYSYPLMFEERSISVLSYNIETLLAEKLETILSRAETNTRMRDFYDVYILQTEKGDKIDGKILRAAFFATCKKRGSLAITSGPNEILDSINKNKIITNQWENYRENNYYVGNVKWNEVIEKVVELTEIIFETQ